MTAIWRFRREDLGEEISALTYEADTGDIPVIVASVDADRNVITKIKGHGAMAQIPGQHLHEA